MDSTQASAFNSSEVSSNPGSHLRCKIPAGSTKMRCFCTVFFRILDELQYLPNIMKRLSVKNLSVLQSLKGKSGFSTATAEVMDICGAGGTASSDSQLLKPFCLPLKNMPLDPKRKGNCSSSKKNTKNKVLCLPCLCHVSFGEGFFAARFSFGASPMSVFGGYIGWLPRRWRGDPVSWTEPVSWDQVVVENKMDPWCCLPSRELTYPTLGKGKSSPKCHFGGIC